MDRPLIGLNMDVVEDEKGISFFHRARYAKAVWDAGGRPILLPPIVQEPIAQCLEGLKGLIMTGGDDLNPALYGGSERHDEEVPVHPLREAFDLELIRAAVQKGLPTLAICLGMQELCVAFGGRLHPYIPDAVPGALEHRLLDGKESYHTIETEPDSRLHCLLGSRVVINSTHRQSVSHPGKKLRVVARTSDGIIEAVEGITTGFLIGVQWHPEMMEHGSGQLRLFKALVEMAQKTHP